MITYAGSQRQGCRLDGTPELLSSPPVGGCLHLRGERTRVAQKVGWSLGGVGRRAEAAWAVQVRSLAASGGSVSPICALGRVSSCDDDFSIRGTSLPKPAACHLIYL